MFDLIPAIQFCAFLLLSEVKAKIKAVAVGRIRWSQVENNNDEDNSIGDSGEWVGWRIERWFPDIKLCQLGVWKGK